MITHVNRLRRFTDRNSVCLIVSPKGGGTNVDVSRFNYPRVKPRSFSRASVRDRHYSQCMITFDFGGYAAIVGDLQKEELDSKQTKTD